MAESVVTEPALERTYLTVKEAAAVLGFSPAYIYQLIVRGQLPVTRFGRRAIRIDRSELNRWLKDVAERGNRYDG